MPHAEIVAIEYCLPERVETNTDLEREHPEWDMAAVSQKTGVVQRHIARDGECASDLAHQACLRLFSRHGIDPEYIDGLVVCSQSPDYIMPHTSALLQKRLGLRKSVAAFDFTLACSGYVYGIAMARGFVESGLLRNVLLVTCDTYSKYIDPSDRGTRTLFGDGAAATLVRRGDHGLGELMLGTDGGGAEKFIVRGGACRSGLNSPASIYMEGYSVLAFVKKEIPGAIQALLCKCQLPLSAIDLFIFHQASKVSLDQLTKLMALPPEKVFRNMERIGNTVSSSIPIALRDAWEAGALRPGSLVMMVGFGVGYSWGVALVRITDNFQRSATS